MKTTAQENPMGFKFGNSEETQPRRIKEMAEVKTFLVSFNDGEGKAQTRLAFRVPGSKTTFLLQEKIGGQWVATSAAPWFNGEMHRKVMELGIEKKDGEGSEGAESV